MLLPWKRWVALAVFVLVLVTVFIRLGEWQLHRLQWRRETNARVLAHQGLPVRPYTELMGGRIGDDDQWRRVSLTGSYDAATQLQVKYRSLAGQQGSELVTVLRTTRGDAVLVDRGFIASGPAGAAPGELPAPPTGEVRVVGYLRVDETGPANATTPTDGTVRLINAAALATTLAYPLLDGYVSLISSEPAQGGDLTPIGLPSLDEGPHLSYAVQWFAFTLIAAGGLVVLIRGDLKQLTKGKQRGSRTGRQGVPDDGGQLRAGAGDGVPAGGRGRQGGPAGP